MWSQRRRPMKSRTFNIQMTSGPQRLNEPAEGEIGSNAARYLWREDVSGKFSQSVLYALRREFKPIGTHLRDMTRSDDIFAATLATTPRRHQARIPTTLDLPSIRKHRAPRM